MIKVTIVSSKTREMKGLSKASQRPYHMAFQDAYFHTVSADGEVAPFPQKVEIDAPKTNGAFSTNSEGAVIGYMPGEYTLQPSSVYVDTATGKLVCRPQLTPLKPAKPTPL